MHFLRKYLLDLSRKLHWMMITVSLLPFSIDSLLLFYFSVAIIQYLAEKYGKDETFYPKDDLLARSIIHHRLAFYLSTYYRRVHDYMVTKF